MDMNNMKYCSDSLAHDYDLFTVKPKKTNNVIDMPKSTTSKKKNTLKATKPSVLTAIAVTFVVLALFGNIFLRAEISKVSTEINEAEAVYSELMSEKTRLNVELEKKVSLGNLEKQAQKLGMQKQEKMQMNYIFAYDDSDLEESADID